MVLQNAPFDFALELQNLFIFKIGNIEKCYLVGFFLHSKLT